MSESRMAAKPTWFEYAADLAKRLAKHDANPTTLVIGILGFSAEDDRIPEWERSMCKAWLDRLVDDQGNPRDDEGLDPLEHAGRFNALQHYGSLSWIETHEPEEASNFDPPWAELRIRVLRLVAEKVARDDLRAKLVPHAEAYVDHLLDRLYGDSASSSSSVPAAADTAKETGDDH